MILCQAMSPLSTVAARLRFSGWVTALAVTLFGAMSMGCESKPCADECQRSGRCTERQSACVATSAERCQASMNCSDYGRCSLKGDECVLQGAADCRRSKKCSLAGECGFRNGACTARSESDCQASEFCRERGMCRFKKKRKGNAICVK